MNADYFECWRSQAKQDINKFELNFINEILGQLSGENVMKRVLEIGIGPGRIAKEILKYTVEYYGVDISNKMIEVFRHNMNNENKIKELIVVDISHQIPFSELLFDIIVAIRVLYYNENWKEVISRFSAKIKPGGIFVFTMLNKRSTAILGALLKSGLVGYYTNKKELLSVLKENGFKNVELRGYARLPDVLYDFCRTKFSSNVLIFFERALRVILGKSFFSRMFYVVAKK